MRNPLTDKDFLKELDSHPQREIYARITALTLQENPVEYIEGKVTGGSINVDGSSAVRRTCNLTMVAQDVNINSFYWGLENKFKLEIGLHNMINPNYPDIIWFNQGMYIITSFSTSQTTNNFTINIGGKDKMCLLNGDIAGKLTSSVDFGVIEHYDTNTKVTTYQDVLITDIIRTALESYGNELSQNIILNDLDNAAVEILEYRGDRPIYLLRDINQDIFVNMTVNGSLPCYLPNNSTKDLKDIIYDNLVEFELNSDATQFYLLPKPSGIDNRVLYTAAKIDYGKVAGYRPSELTYAGDLIANVGETITSVLDKIKNMLGEYEYFYDIDGRFIFQKKRSYVDIPWNPTDTDGVVDGSEDKTSYVYSFIDSKLVTSFSNAPNLLNLRNDYCVWGKKKGVSGVDLDIHMRYAIDKKPTSYYSLTREKIFATDEYDWRELIYQMALDYRQYYYNHPSDYKELKDLMMVTDKDWSAIKKAFLVSSFVNASNSSDEKEEAWTKFYTKYKYDRDSFLVAVAEHNYAIDADGKKTFLYPTGKTGYEQYYVDLEGFWRQLYNRFEIEKDKSRGVENFKEEDYFDSSSPNWGWNKNVIDNPENLLFWFDFMDVESNEMGDFSVPVVGSRTNSINDDNVNAIYYRDIPNVLFIDPSETPGEDFERETGFVYIQLQPYMTNLFSMTSARKSAKEAIEEAMYKYSYCIESATINTVPIYYLEPNVRIYLRDDKSKIDGEYIINKLSIPLTYNGMMQISATKAVSKIK